MIGEIFSITSHFVFLKMSTYQTHLNLALSSQRDIKMPAMTPALDE
jgi:hypothetical protein